MASCRKPRLTRPGRPPALAPRRRRPHPRRRQGGRRQAASRRTRRRRRDGEAIGRQPETTASTAYVAPIPTQATATLPSAGGPRNADGCPVRRTVIRGVVTRPVNGREVRVRLNAGQRRLCTLNKLTRTGSHVPFGRA